MRIAVVTPSFTPFLVSAPAHLAQGLSERGHRVDLITTDIRTGREVPYSKEQAQPGLAPLYRVLRAPTIVQIDDNAWPRTRALLREMAYDAVILSEDYPLICHAAGRRAISRGIPYVIFSERYYDPPRFLPAMGLKVFNRTVHRRLWAHARAIACHSTECMEYLARQGAPRSKLAYMPGCVDARYFRDQSAPIRAELAARGARGDNWEFPEIISVARLHPYKGIPTLLRAMKLLRDRGCPGRLRIIGRGTCEGEYRASISSLGLGEQVQIDTAAIQHLRMPIELARSRIYVQPSRIEPFGMSVVEAMACGLPVVASSVGGLRNSVMQGETGLLVPPDDPVALAGALEELLRDPVRSETLGRQAQERAVEVFDYRKVSARYEELLLSL